VAFLDQVDQRYTTVLVLLGHTDHETQVRANQRLYRLLIAGQRAMTKLDLLLRCQQLVTADFAQVLIECRALFIGAREPVLYVVPPAAPTRLGHACHVSRSPAEFDSTARAADSLCTTTARSLPPRRRPGLSGISRRAFLKPRRATGCSARARARKMHPNRPSSRCTQQGVDGQQPVMGGLRNDPSCSTGRDRKST